MKTPQLIDVPGYEEFGSRGLDLVRELAYADLDREFPDGWRDRYDRKDREVVDFVLRRYDVHLHLPSVVKAHNKAVPLAVQYAHACFAAERAIAHTEALYADLSKNTTINWLAAHHRYMLALVQAQDLLTGRVDAAIALAGSDYAKASSLSRVIYEGEVPAGQRIELPDVDAAQLDLAAFVEQARTRIDVLRATVSGGYPEGFAPPVAPAQAGPVDDDWAADHPASVAVVAGKRRW